MLDVNPSGSDMDKFNSVQLTFECAREDVEAIMALVIPFLQPELESEIPVALPGALIKLAKWLALDVEKGPNPFWNQAAIDTIYDFAERMVALDNELSYEYGKWADRFLDDLSALEERNESGFEDIFLAVRIVVQQIRTGQCQTDQRTVYFSRGKPLAFRTWVDRILRDRVTNQQISVAHFWLFDPGRLKQLLQSADGISNDPGGDVYDEPWW